MANLIYTEILKLKRSYMFIVSLIGASVAPILNFLMFYQYEKERGEAIKLLEFGDQINMFVVLIIGSMLYGLITTYLFNREYEEDTLKNLLTIPVGRFKLILSKVILLLGWIELLSIFAVFLTIILALIGGFSEITLVSILIITRKFVIGGSLLFLLTFPVIFITLLFKNYVPSIAFTIAVTIGSFIMVNSEKVVYYPWGSAYMLVTNKVPLEDIVKAAETSVYTPLLSIIITGIVGLIATMIFFKNQDVA